MLPSINFYLRTKPPEDDEKEALPNDGSKRRVKFSDQNLQSQRVSELQSNRGMLIKAPNEPPKSSLRAGPSTEPGAQVATTSKTVPSRPSALVKKRAPNSGERPRTEPRKSKHPTRPHSAEGSNKESNKLQTGREKTVAVANTKSSCEDESTEVTARKRSSSQQQQPPLDSLMQPPSSSGQPSGQREPDLGETWFRALKDQFDEPYFLSLSSFVQDQRQKKTVFPPREQVYTWTRFHAIEQTRVVILGQEPYHGPNQAHGLSFSVGKGISIPNSLANIFKELQSDVSDFEQPGHGNLSGWSKQGVLLLNTCLTVNKNEPNSHTGRGWGTLIEAVICWISKNVAHNVVFLLWGKHAQRKARFIARRHKILTAALPSNDKFLGCKHFSQTNAYLRSKKLTPINWSAL